MILRMSLICAVVALAACQSAPPEPELTVERRERGPDALMYGMKLTQVVGGRIEWQIEAKKAWYSRSTERLHGRKVHVYFYPEGRDTATLYASSVLYERKSGRMLARGRVVLESEETRLVTTELEFDSKRSKVFSRKPVRITRGSNVITGIGLEADLDLGNLKILEPHVEARDPQELEPLVDLLDKR